MRDVMPFVVAGLVSGAVYGLAAVGLVLTYRTSGIFNFAHGALATVSAYCFYTLHIQEGLPWLVAAAVCLFVVAPLLGVVLEVLARAVARATLELRIAAMIGVLLVVEAGATLLYGRDVVRAVPVFLPSGTFRLAGVTVQVSDAVTFGIAVVVTAVLSLTLHLTRRGVAMRAVVDDPDLLDLAGTSPTATRRVAWCVGAGLASLSGILFAPLLPLDPLQLTLLVVQAFGAAAIGRFSSLPTSFAGGLIVGVASALATRYFTSGLLAGVPAATPFLALFLVLLLIPKRYLPTRVRDGERNRSDWRMPWSAQLPLLAALVAALALVPAFAGIHLTDWTVALAMVIVFLSLGLLVRTSGQVSLSHVAFTAIGAASFAHLAGEKHVPWALALFLSGLIAVPIGAALAIPAIRLSGLYLALATFGFGIVVQYMFYTQGYMFGDTGAGLLVPRPSVFGLQADNRYYWLVLGLAILTTLGVVALTHGRLGRLLRGLADSPTALRTNGVSIEVTRVLVFCISAFLAACGGALAGAAQTTVSADSYQPLLSVTWFAVIVVVIGHEPWYAVMAAAALVLVPSYLTGATVGDEVQLLFGALAVVVGLTARQRRTPMLIRAAFDRLPRVRHRRRTTARTSAPVPPVPAASLDVSDLSVRYGGVVAVEGFELVAPTAQITGLIGPNGAGKTTTFNACSGLVRAGGTIRLAGHDVSRRSPASRARRGLGRTFQKMELLDSLSVGENVALGAEGARAGWNPLRHLLSFPGDRSAVRDATATALELCGIEDLAERRVGSLSTGQRRLVELARCLAGPYSILLLDEPSSGLDHAESRRFGEIVRRVVAQRGVGVLMVEHDMALVLEICDQIYVLDFGKPIFRGTPAEVRSSQIVQAAYLGEPVEVDGVLPDVSGPFVGISS